MLGFRLLRNLSSPTISFRVGLGVVSISVLTCPSSSLGLLNELSFNTLLILSLLILYPCPLIVSRFCIIVCLGFIRCLSSSSLSLSPIPLSLQYLYKVLSLTSTPFCLNTSKFSCMLNLVLYRLSILT